MRRADAFARLDELLDEELRALETDDHDAVVRVSAERSDVLVALAHARGDVPMRLARSVLERSRRNELAAATRLAELRIAISRLGRSGSALGAYRPSGPRAATPMLDTEG